VGEGCGAGEDVYVDLGGEVGRREEKDNAEAQRTQRSAEKEKRNKEASNDVKIKRKVEIVRAWDAPFEAQGKAVLRPYKIQRILKAPLTSTSCTIDCRLVFFFHYVGGAVGAAEHGVGFVVADHFFGGGVELQRAAEAV
jgi:hypothetical protein